MREIRELLRRLADGGTTIFISSHLLAEVEAMCDRVGVMARGRLVAEGPPGTLRGTTDRIRIDGGRRGRRPRRARPVAGRLGGADEPGTGGHRRHALRRVGRGRRERRAGARRASACTRSNRSGTRSKTSSSISSRASMYRVELWQGRCGDGVPGCSRPRSPASRSSSSSRSASRRRRRENSQDAPPFLLQIVQERAVRAAHRPRAGPAVLHVARDRAVRRRCDRGRGADRDAPLPVGSPGATAAADRCRSTGRR